MPAWIRRRFGEFQKISMLFLFRHRVVPSEVRTRGF
jgi:hypothetical protein